LPAAESFTLLVPTYNRPGELGRLLRYLSRQPIRFPVIVLDSSEGPAREANARLARMSATPVEVVSFDASITPFEKFGRGAERTQTEFCALCADDDILLPEAVPALTEFLAGHPAIVAAHGWYFGFSLGTDLAITSMAYRGPSLDDEDPLRRLRRLLGGYEAVTYAVYRTEILRQVLQEAGGVRSLLGRELLGAELTAVLGQVARLPVLYYGRAVAGSGPHIQWHPVEFLLSSPEELLAEYARIREVVTAWLAKVGPTDRSAEDTRRVVDLLHLRYLSEYVTPGILDYLVDGVLGPVDPGELLRGYWPRLGRPPGGPLAALRRSAVLRAIRDRVAPRLRLAHLGLRPRVMTCLAPTASGAVRRYRIHADFFREARALYGKGGREAVEKLAHALAAYE